MRAVAVQWRAVCALSAVSVLSYAQGMLLPEEYVEGKDIAVRKTPVPSFVVPEPVVRFPGMPFIYLPEDRSFTETGHLVDGIPARCAESGRVLAGSHGTVEAGIDLTVRRFTLSARAGRTDGYRDWSAADWQTFGVTWSRQPDALFSAEAARRGMQLPGPVESPFFDRHRDGWRLAMLGKRVFGETGPELTIEETRCEVEAERWNFARLSAGLPLGNWRAEGFVQDERLEGRYRRSGGGAGARWTDGGTELFLGLKAIEDAGVRLAPAVTVRLGEHLFWTVDSCFESPDIWKDVLEKNYLEGAGEIQPEERYRTALTARWQRQRYRASAWVSVAWWETLWTLADSDADGLWEPRRIPDVWEGSLRWETVWQVAPSWDVFADGEARLFSRDVDGIPRYALRCGVTGSRGKVSAGAWIECASSRRFGGEHLGGVVTGNLRTSLLLNDHSSLHLEVNNISDTRWQIVPGYPAEGRQITVSLRRNF